MNKALSICVVTRPKYRQNDIKSKTKIGGVNRKVVQNDKVRLIAYKCVFHWGLSVKGSDGK